jgi:hypothetical protein
MALSSDRLAQIAFKNLQGKSQTEQNKDLPNETLGLGFTVQAFNVTIDELSPTASNSVSQGIAVKVTADLTAISDANGSGYYTVWPSVPPAGNDIRRENKGFTYGEGSLSGIVAGQRMTDLISESIGISYKAIPYDQSGNKIDSGDTSDWIFQYNPGIMYIDKPPIVTAAGVTRIPTTMEVYYYIGSRLSDFSQNTQPNIRVSATNSVSSTSQDVYFASYSTPTISTYSTNYLFLVDFYSTNQSSTVSLNINGIGTTSVVKFNSNGPVPLSPGDITGATGGTSGQIYYLVYNNGVFEFYPKNPLSEPGFFTQPSDTAKSLGGIEKGTQFDKVSIQEMFKDLLYPELLGQITGFSMSNNSGQVLSYEVGNRLPRQVYTFSWGTSGEFKDSTLKIEDASNVTSEETFWKIPSATPFTQSSIATSPVSFQFGATISSNVSNTRTFKISLTRKNGTVISKFIDVPWMWKVYYGSSTWSTLTASQVFSLGGTLATQSVGSWTISGSGYKYIAFPEDNAYNFNSINYKGLPFTLAGTPSGYSYSYSDVNYLFVTVSNTYGVSKQYKVYRSKNQISATISVNII